MRKNITNDIRTNFVPRAILEVFGTERTAGGVPERLYLEIRRVENGVLSEARPASRDFLKAIAENFRDTSEKHPHGAVPKNLLYADSRFGSERYVWWNPPKARQMHFVATLGIPDGTYNMPGTVYSVSRNTLSVFIFRGKQPRQREQLLKGPFFNYYSDGRVCLGNSKCEMPKDVTWQDILDHWEKLFWGSINSHLIDNPVEGNLVLLLKEAADKPFDITKCHKAGITLDQLLK